MEFKKGILISAICCISGIANAYTISPKDDIHESITRTAKLCFDSAVDENKKPESCPAELTDEDDDVDMVWLHDSSISLLDIRDWYNRARGYSAKYPNLEEAVRWPDDPTREIGVRGIVKFSAKMLSDCDAYLKDNENGRNDINDGLLCNSHVGDMQFLHAQASYVGEPAIDTYQKITRWATFLYEVASGHMSNADLDQNYCDYFSGEDIFSKAMLPNKDSVPCEDKKDPKWKLTTLFTFKCGNPVSSEFFGCYEEKRSSRFDKARINAAGALLHLIQDSYSQSHVERGKCSVSEDKVVAKIECSAPTMFTTYRGQHNHGDADRAPVFGASCSRDSMDPVLASAIMLWNIHEKSPVSEFTLDLEKVFGNKDHILANTNPANVGQCFSE